MVDVNDRKNLYEVREMEDYENTKAAFANRYPDVQIHEQKTKWPWIIVIGLMAVMFLILIILLGINGVTLTHLNTLPVCDNSNTANTGGLTGGNNNTSGGTCSSVNCNCSVQTTWSPEVAQQIGRILNTTSATAWKVDGIVNYTTIDLVNNQNSSNLLGQIGQMLYNQISQVLTTAQDTAGKVDDIRAFTVDQTTNTENITATLYQVLSKSTESAQKLTNIVNTLANIKDTASSSAAVIDDILLIADELLSLQNASSIFNSITPVSCADIKRAIPNSPSGYYHVNSRNIYCNMGELCNSTKGWTRLAYLNMNDATTTCPSGFRYYQNGPVRACGRPSNSPSCVGLTFPTNGINYTQICGRVTGWQRASTDANNGGGQHNNLNSYYLDGVSITRGSPREHVWSFMSGVWENRVSQANCPCNTGTNRNNQAFIGNNYYCESGNPTQGIAGSIYTSDPLWDGQLCRNREVPCCTNPNLPWFYRSYGNVSSNAYLELRVCGDEGWLNEDTPVSFYELYVQ